MVGTTGIGSLITSTLAKFLPISCTEGRRFDRSSRRRVGQVERDVVAVRAAAAAFLISWSMQRDAKSRGARSFSLGA